MKCDCRCEAVFPHGLTSGTQDRLEKLGATDQLVKFKHVPGKAQEIVSLLLTKSKWAMMGRSWSIMPEICFLSQECLAKILKAGAYLPLPGYDRCPIFEGGFFVSLFC